MKKNIILATLFSLLTTSVLSQSNVTIEGRIKGLPAGRSVYLQSFSAPTRDSAATAFGRFSISTRVEPGEANVYILQIGRDHNINNAMLVYLDEGKVRISGKGPGFKDAKATGIPALKDYNSFNAEMDKVPQLKGRKELYKRSNELETKDSVAYRALEQEVRKMREAESLFTVNWVKEHPSSPISAFLIRGIDNIKLADKETLYNSLDESARNNTPAKYLANEFRVARAKDAAAIGKVAPLFTQNDTLGKPVNLADFKGRYVLVDFWASWCVPCRKENPNVVEAFKQYQSRNFTVLGVAFERPEDKGKWIKAIHDDKLTWTHVSDLSSWDNAAGRLYGIRSIPANVLIGPDGIIIGKDLRGEALFAKLEELLNTASSKE